MVIYENGKITAISKELLNLFNVSLKELSPFIKKIDLEIKSITKTPVKILDYEFEVKKEELLTLKDLEVFRLKKVKEAPKEETIQMPEISLEETKPEEEVLKVSPKEETIQMPEISLEETKPEEEVLKVSPKEETIQMPEISLEETKPEEEVLKVSPKEETIQMPEISLEETKPEEEVLKVSPKEETIQMPEISLEETKPEEEVLKVSPKEETIQMPEISLEETKPEEEVLKVSPKEETIQMPEISLEETKPEEEVLKVSPKEETIQMPEISLEETKPEEEHEEETIELSFEDNITKCEKIFKQKDKINEVIKEELKEATEELGIDEELANELFEDLLNQIMSKKDELYKAIEKKDYEEIHKIAHFLKGASLNLRLSNLAFIFKTIDEEAKNKTDINVIKNVTDKLYDFITPLLNKKETSENQQENKITVNLDPKIKNLVINTIRYYLETQDEVKFQKDKKFLEKLLKTKINSINDLKHLMEAQQ